MNSIQQISQHIYTRNLMLELGLDPAMDLPAAQVKQMWHELNRERLMASNAPNIESEDDPSAFRFYSNE